jgi:glucan phosphoethanolaminetransferase (alkaline phosphatase superfamily)
MAGVARFRDQGRGLYRAPAAPVDIVLLAFRLLLLGAILAISNFLIFNRIDVLLTQGRMMPLLVLGAMWLAGVSVLVALLFEPRAWLRMAWGALFAAAGASAFAFQSASGSEMSAFDALGLLDAAHEGGRAAANNMPLAMLAVLVGVATLVLYAPAVRFARLRGLMRGAAHLTGVGLVAAISAIVFLKEGSGTQGLPKQFSQLAIGAVAGFKDLTVPARARKAVTWQPSRAQSLDRIVMLVDESVRPDYIDLSRLAPTLIDFGPTASGGVCSNTSNAILRLAAARKDLGSAINAMPTIWQYAKAAGYRTVFIDAQARHVGGGGLQNFMTLAETRDIDRHYRIDAEAFAADEELRKIIVKELAGDTRVFIYADKEGAHFPYDINYPPDAALYHPTQTEAGARTLESNAASYRNAIAWNVTRFMEALFAEAHMQDMALVYTSDHGQQLHPGTVTHCVTETADPRMALVPMLAITSDAALNEKLKAGAAASRGRASHFQIAPSLLSFMGYAEKDVARRYDESLTRAPSAAPQFTTRDVLGMFSAEVTWNDIDLTADYLEKPETPMASVAP